MNKLYREKERILGKDLLQDQNKDIVINNNDLMVTEGTQGVIQRLLNKIFSFVYSLFAHPFWGGYFQSLVSKNMTNSLITEVRSTGIQEFLEEPEVVEVSEFKVTPVKHLHLLEIDATVKFGTDLNIENIKSTLNVRF